VGAPPNGGALAVSPVRSIAAVAPPMPAPSLASAPLGVPVTSSRPSAQSPRTESRTPAVRTAPSVEAGVHEIHDVSAEDLKRQYTPTQHTPTRSDPL
jgi:hypothetical protein